MINSLNAELNPLEETWKEVLVACFKVLSQCLVDEEA